MKDLERSHGVARNSGSRGTESDAIKNVCWSLGARNTASTPEEPLAPGLLSITTVCPRRLRAPSAAARAATSWEPSAGNGTTNVAALNDEFFKRGHTPPIPVVESPSFFYSLSIVAHTDLLTCCAHTAALHSGHATSILPIALGTESTPVALFWRKSSQFAQWAADELAA